MRSALRVLQAADLNLHEPLDRVGKLPAHLREIHNHARERAALNVFDAAIAQQVDLLLLTGSLADCRCEPRLAHFLMEQFRRLHRAGVSVLWAMENSHPLPTWVLAPEYVTCLCTGQSVRFCTHRDSRCIQVCWTAQPESSHRTLPLAEVQIELSSDERCGVVTSVEFQTDSRALPARLPILPVQSHGPIDSSLSGMWLVTCPENEQPQARLLPTAAVGWEEQTVNLEAFSSRQELLNELSHSTQRIHEQARCDVAFISWELTGSSDLWEELLSDDSANRLLREIQRRTPRGLRAWAWRMILQPSAEQFRNWMGVPALTQRLFQRMDSNPLNVDPVSLNAGFPLRSSRGIPQPREKFSTLPTEASHAQE